MMVLKKIVADKNLIAYCGLYCGACKKYLKGRCSGCHQNEGATWCKVRNCCIENSYLSCADCKEFSNQSKCKMFNNFISKVFALIFRSDRQACIDLIKEKGYEHYAQKMISTEEMVIKR